MRLGRKTIWVVVALLVSAAVVAFASGPYGSFNYRKHGVMDGNLVVTDFYNYGMIANWDAKLVTIWPKGTTHGYIDGVALIIIGSAVDIHGNRIHPMSTMYREDMGNDQDPVTKRWWGWEPLPGYANPNQDEPAMSDNADTWPFSWPDQDASWAGFWNGYFGKGVKNADLETFFVMDDANDAEYAFYPDATDSVRRGLGLQVEVRAFQWSQVLAEDCIFWHYDVKNVSTTSYDSMAFGMLIDWGVGGVNNSADDAGRYNTTLDIAYAWDLDNTGDYGWSPVGYAGYAFLESPGIGTDGIDNDEDGLVDERRDSGPGDYISDPNDPRASIGNFGDPMPHWTGDEDGDWDAFTDRNENGTWDEDEPLNDDVGMDGIGPADEGYYGPDEGEGDGRPTEGEPDFDALDKDESDQIGLTAFHIFPVHQYALSNEEQDWYLASRLVPPTDDQIQQGVNLGMMFFSGTFPLGATLQERFSMALLFGNDLQDLTRNKNTVQAIYNANYNFAQPPWKPTLFATAGDNRVTLHWDKRAEGSYDRFLQEHDFEGYRVYRSTDPSFIDSRVITDAYGNITFRKPLFQYDLKDGRKGPMPVSVFGAHFDLGEDTGIRNTIIDTTVTNGITYYYAIVSYDYGKIAGETRIDTLHFVDDQNQPYDSLVYTFVPELDENGNIVGIPPSECTSTILGNVGETVQLDINTAAVIPSAPAAGFIQPSLKDGLVHLSGEASGEIEVNILFPDSLVNDRVYEIQFDSTGLYKGFLNFAQAYKILDATTQEVLYQSDSTVFGEFGPYVEGDATFLINPSNPRTKFFKRAKTDTVFWHQKASLVESPVIDGWTVTMLPDFIDYANADDLGTDSVYAPAGFHGNYSGIVRLNQQLERFSLKMPMDMELRWIEQDTVVTVPLLGSYLQDTVNFQLWNTTSGEEMPFAYREYWFRDDFGDSLLQNIFIQPIINFVPSSDLLLTWNIELTAPASAIQADIEGFDTTYTIVHTEVLPQPGDVIRIATPIPFCDSDRYTFSIQGPGFDKAKARREMDNIAVVPNPYVGASVWEPRVNYSTGRGPRKIDFIHLPPKCTIRIYTIAGYLVQTVEHNTSNEDGSESWNLVSKDGMDIAFGVYLYHVDAPGIGTHIGKFAVIK